MSNQLAKMPLALPPSRLCLAARVATALVAAGAHGCTQAEDETMADESLDGIEVNPPGALAQQNVSPPPGGPDGSYFAKVTALGSGCPEGSAVTRISADGQVFTTTFSEYQASVNPSTDVSVSDCQITIKLHSPSGQSYAVHSFYYQGTSYLEEGVSGLQTANYYFQGAPVAARSLRSELRGPYDDDYLIPDEVQTPEEYIWSPCGVERDLQIVTRLRVQNSAPRRSGLMTLSALDGATRLEFKLAWKSCTVPSAATPAQPPPTTRPQNDQQQPSDDGRAPTGLGDVVGGVVSGLGDVLGGVGDTLGGVLGGLLGN